MNVIPPGLDFSNLKVNLPEDPVIKEMQQHKPAYGGSTPKAPQDSPKSGGGRTPKNMSESSKQQLLPSQLVCLNMQMMHSPKHAMFSHARLLSSHTWHTYMTDAQNVWTGPCTLEGFLVRDQA